MKNLLVLSAIILPSIITALDIGQLGAEWAEIKYSDRSDQEKIEQYDRWIVTTKASGSDQVLWLSVGRSTRASLIGGLSAANEIATFLPELSNRVQDPKTPMEGMVCAMCGYLYGKLPGWPLSIGSNQRAEELLEAAKKYQDDGDICFYLAHGYYSLKDDISAKYYLQKAMNDFSSRTDSTYKFGKIEELKKLELDLS